MRFESPLAFLLLLLIPLAVFLYFRMQRGGSLAFSNTRNMAGIKPSWKQRLIHLPLALRILALTLLIVALARPQSGTEQVRDISHGIAVEMVVDRSGSMGQPMSYAGDRASRLDVVKEVFSEFVAGNHHDLAGRPNDLIGMVTFARYAETVCPLTLAHGAISKLLDHVVLVTRRNEDGTAIGDAVALAAARLEKTEETLARQTGRNKQDYKIKSKIIILLTDGQNNAGERTPAEAAELARKWGIKIYTIGVGGRGQEAGNGLFSAFFARMRPGVDKEILKAMADPTGGKFYMAEDADSLRDIYADIDRMEKSRIESVRYMDYRELFAPLAYAGLGLLFLEILLSNTVFRRIP